MPWASSSLLDNFQIVVRSIHAFRKEFGKTKYDEFLANMSSACFEILNLLHQDEMPPAADQFISSASGGIKTAIQLLSDAKDGAEKGAEFRKKIFELYEYVINFSKNGGTEAKQKQELQIKKNNLVILPEDEEEPVLHLVSKSALDNRLLTYDELLKLIQEIGEPCQLQSVSPISIFKRAVNHAYTYYPILTKTGTAEVTVGIGFLALHELNKIIAPAINQWLLATTCANVPTEYLVPGALTLLGGGKLLVAISNSKPRRPRPPIADIELQGVPEEQQGLLRGKRP